MTPESFIPRLESLTRFDFTENLDTIAEELNADLGSGMCKSCFVLRDEDYVIKFHTSIRSQEQEIGSCEAEIRNYASAKVYGVERVLLETRYLCTSKATGIRFYVQPKIDELACRPSGHTRKKLMKINHTVTRKIVRTVNQNCYYSGLDDTWVKAMVSLYGKRFARSFEQWTKHNRVNDLHNENVGYYHGKPVIFDYAGY